MSWILVYTFCFFLTYSRGKQNDGLPPYQQWPDGLSNYGIPRSHPYMPPGVEPQERNYPHIPNVAQGFSEYSDDEQEQGAPVMQRQHPGWSFQPPVHAAPPPQAAAAIKSPFAVIPEWPVANVPLGQISAVSFDNEGHIVIFHRGDHVWNTETFSLNDVYNMKDSGPVAAKTVIVYDVDSGNVIHQWGNDLFFMPHGLTVDKDSNIWVTDVALHQVFKFPPGGSAHPLLVLGTRFQPGSDDSHFCKPTSVAVASNGDFFVSDGYCNHRVIKYDSSGKKLLQWGRAVPLFADPTKPPPSHVFSVPHSLVLAEDHGQICVADRENGRIQCFSMFNGTFVSMIKLPQFGGKLFSLAYSPIQGGLIYAINGANPANYFAQTVRGFVIGLTSKQLVAEFTPGAKGFSTPHDIAVSKDGRIIYVVELDPHKVWKFIDKARISEFPPSRLEVVSENATVTVSTTSSPKPAVIPHSESTQPPNPQLAGLSSYEPPAHLLSLTAQIFVATAAVLALTMVSVLFVLLRRKSHYCNCWLCYKRWQFRRGNAGPEFKLGSLLDPHSGFEQVCTEMSDEEEIDSAAAGTNNNGSTTSSLIPRA